MPPWHEKNVDAIISALEKLEGKFALFPLMEWNRSYQTPAPNTPF